MSKKILKDIMNGKRTKKTLTKVAQSGDTALLAPWEPA